MTFSHDTHSYLVIHTPPVHHWICPFSQFLCFSTTQTPIYRHPLTDRPVGARTHRLACSSVCLPDYLPGHFILDLSLHLSELPLISLSFFPPRLHRVMFRNSSLSQASKLPISLVDRRI